MRRRRVLQGDCVIGMHPPTVEGEHRQVGEAKSTSVDGHATPTSSGVQRVAAMAAARTH